MTSSPARAAVRTLIQVWNQSPNPRSLKFLSTVLTVAFASCIWRYFKHVQKRRVRASILPVAIND